MQLVVVLVGFEVVDGLLPICRQDILELTVQTLMHVCPRSCVELSGCEAGVCKLGFM